MTADPQRPAEPVPGAPADEDAVPRWLSSGAAIAWRLLAIVAAVAMSVYALAYLRVVVVPLIIALLLSTALRPPTRWLTRHRFSDAAAAGSVMLGLLAVLVTALTMAGAAVGRQFSDLADSIQEGVREAGEVLAEPPFELSQADIDRRIDDTLAQLSDSGGSLSEGVLHGAVVVGELLTGLIITLLLLFFFLKDGPGLWRWVVETSAGARGRAWTRWQGAPTPPSRATCEASRSSAPPTR